MGFFDYVFRGLGFETEAAEGQEVKKSKRKKSSEVALEEPKRNKYAGFSFGPSFYNNDPAQVQMQQTQNGVQLSKNVIIYTPRSQEDIKNIIDFLKRREPIIVNFSYLSETIAPPCLAFVNGALYALKGSIHPIADDLFLLTPEGVSILVPKDQVAEMVENDYDKA